MRAESTKTIPFRFTRAFETSVAPSPNVQAVAAMFGIGVDESHALELYRDLELRLGAGRIVYLTGDSGAGKSCLLRDIRARLESDERFEVIPDIDIEALPDRPIIDQFGDWPIQRIGETLNYVGIAEAFIFLRRPRELSDGQRYRFMLAQAIYRAEGTGGAPDASRIPAIFFDEYLACLDRETARNVAYQTRRVATRSGMLIVVATTHVDIAQDLQANTTVTMRLALPPEVKIRAML